MSTLFASRLLTLRTLAYIVFLALNIAFIGLVAATVPERAALGSYFTGHLVATLTLSSITFLIVLICVFILRPHQLRWEISWLSFVLTLSIVNMALSLTDEYLFSGYTCHYNERCRETSTSALSITLFVWTFLLWLGTLVFGIVHQRRSGKDAWTHSFPDLATTRGFGKGDSTRSGLVSRGAEEGYRV